MRLTAERNVGKKSVTRVREKTHLITDTAVVLDFFPPETWSSFHSMTSSLDIFYERNL